MIRNVTLLNTYCIAEFSNVAVGGACIKHTALKVWERKRELLENNVIWTIFKHKS